MEKGELAMNNQKLIKKWESKEGVPSYEISAFPVNPSLNEMYIAGYGVARKEILDDLKQLDEPKKVVVPKFVAEWIKYAKQQGYGFMQSYDPKKMFYPINDGLDKWIDDNEETFAHAWLVGYEVKKEPIIHELKILPEYFEAVVSGNKRFEIRKNDRNYKKGDILRLNEYQDGQYTGDVHVAEITYITDYAQQDGYVVLGIK